MSDGAMANGATMRAWQSAAPGLPALEIVRRPVPVAGPGEILVRVEAAALNFSDLLMIDDKYQVRPPRPFVPGQELAGIVTAAGAGVHFLPGERVAGKVLWGAFADYAVMRADMASRLPDGTDAAVAAAIPVVYTTAMVALTESTQVLAGETVLVLAAAGGVGLAAVEIARHLGAHVIAAASGDKGALAVEHGAAAAVDYGTEGWAARVRELTGGRGADVIIDPVGGSLTREALRTLAWAGRLLVVGFASGEIPMIPANRLLLNRASAIGVYWNHDRDAEMLAGISRRLSAMLAAGAVRPHVGARSPFGRLPEALEALAGRRTTGKSVLLTSEEP